MISIVSERQPEHLVARCGTGGVCRKLFTAEAKYNSGAVAEVVLPVIVPIRSSCQKVFGLKRTNRQMSGNPYIDPPPAVIANALNEPKVIPSSSQMRPRRTSEWSDSATPSIDSRPGEIRNLMRGPESLPRQRITTQLTYQA
jgi:hypothetical protein